ncbi:MAG: hypothetical protein IAG10_19270, partial [Planctomycetaceae bacterium]|nr:hypothetical protein [Planctomycetaceae bacterium]
MAASISLKDIKPHEGARWRAFEEMCFQLFAAEFGNEGGVVRREGSGGDGGLEGYICDVNDNETIGLQAKFFDKNLAQGQWNQVNKAVTTALRCNAGAKSLELYVIAVPRNLTKAQRETWTRWKKSWSSVAKALGYAKSPKFELWDESKLQQLLLKPDNRGQLLYWFDFQNFDRARCCQLTDASILGLGDRYIEQSHQGLHTRTYCEEGIHRFLRTERSRREFHRQASSFLRELCHAPWRQKKDWSSATKAKARSANRELDEIVRLLRDGISLPSEIGVLANAAKKCADSIITLRSARLAELEAESEDKSKSTNTAFNRPNNPFQLCRDEFGDRDLTGWSYWLSGTASMADAQFLLVTGDVGMGKSHLLAETCRRFNEAGGAALFVEGAKFGTSELPWIQLMKWADVATRVRDFLDAYSGLAATTLLCGLVCIDAVNETPNREVWLNQLHSFAEELRPFPNIKLIVSCRSDFLELSVPEAVRQGKADGWRVLRHQGFNASVGQAVQSYLKAYDVRGGSTQLYSDEFQRPLMLKIFCEAFEGRQVPKGTLSLEDVLAKYVERKCRNICDRIGCKPTVIQSALRSISQAMASASSTKLAEPEARKILRDYHSPSSEDKSLYHALLSEGILLETAIRAADGLGLECYIRFSYERIWDYFISLVFLPRRSTPSSELLERLS